MSRVYSVCRAYGTRMSKVYSIRSQTLINEHVQKINLASAYNTTYTNVCQRIWNVDDVCLTYP